MKKWQITLIVIGVLVIPIFFGAYELGMMKVFMPAKENIRRGVFENTKSYMHGVQQDLGKYFLEYQKADESGKEAIRATILMRFAEVDANKLQNDHLKRFLISTRGY